MPKLKKGPRPAMSFPVNSKGDLFRLLPFEGYQRVISFLRVLELREAAPVSKGWHYAVASRAKVDETVPCQSLQDIMSFLRRLECIYPSPTGICFDVTRIPCGVEWQKTPRQLHCNSATHVTWRCEVFFAYHAAFLEVYFPRLKFLRLDFVNNTAPGKHLRVPMPKLKCLSVAVSKNRRETCAGVNMGGAWHGSEIDFCGDDLPQKLKSLRLEGISFKMPNHSIVESHRMLRVFLYKQDRDMLESVYLDVDGAWWDKWQSKVEEGILDWIRRRPNLTQFCMGCLNPRLQMQIRRILWERLKKKTEMLCAEDYAWWEEEDAWWEEEDAWWEEEEEEKDLQEGEDGEEEEAENDILDESSSSSSSSDSLPDSARDFVNDNRRLAALAPPPLHLPRHFRSWDHLSLADFARLDQVSLSRYRVFRAMGP